MEDIVRRTTTDAVYEILHDEIRNAFTKLGNEELLVIRPQKATEVRGFSMDRVALARLVRLSVELEITRHAIPLWDSECEAKLEKNLDLQEKAINAGDLPTFHALDYDFHRLICTLSNNPLAFEVILDCKQKVDRLCVLSLTKDSEAKSVLKDHRDIAEGLASGDPEKARLYSRNASGLLRVD